MYPFTDPEWWRQPPHVHTRRSPGRGKHRRNKPPYRPIVEVLEDRTLPSVTIGGIVFNDLNANLLRDAGEVGVPNVSVFLDQNQDGVLDNRQVTFNGSTAFV